MKVVTKIIDKVRKEKNIFYFNKLLEAKKKEKEEYDKVNKKSGSNGPGVRVRR